jgi:hypothetical protein
MDFAEFLDFLINTFIKPATAVILGLAVVYFLWNIAEGIRTGDNPEKRSEMKIRAAWGIVAIAVMVSLWGLVSILLNTFDIDSGAPPVPSASYSLPSNDSSPWRCDSDPWGNCE